MLAEQLLEKLCGQLCVQESGGHKFCRCSSKSGAMSQDNTRLMVMQLFSKSKGSLIHNGHVWAELGMEGGPVSGSPSLSRLAVSYI